LARGRCPRCGKAITWAGNLYRPFCSETCKLIDLGKWIDEEYRIANDNPMPDEKEPAAALTKGSPAVWPEGRGEDCQR
jgi:endogenous inhibitor of DNA gyrase (YacG/DUF329 family)